MNRPKLIVERRNDLGMTQKELANEIAINHAHLSRLESGEFALGWKLANKFSSVINVDPGKIFVKNFDYEIKAHCGTFDFAFVEYLEGNEAAIEKTDYDYSPYEERKLYGHKNYKDPIGIKSPGFNSGENVMVSDIAYEDQFLFLAAALYCSVQPHFREAAKILMAASGNQFIKGFSNSTYPDLISECQFRIEKSLEYTWDDVDYLRWDD